MAGILPFPTHTIAGRAKGAKGSVGPTSIPSAYAHARGKKAKWGVPFDPLQYGGFAMTQVMLASMWQRFTDKRMLSNS